jgi:flagellar protein FliS
MLLDGAIRYCNRAIEAIEARDIEQSYFALDKAQRIALQLSAGLKREANPKIVDQMTALYQFIYNRLVDANMSRSREPVDDALRILHHQRETWAVLIDKLVREFGEKPPAQAATPSLAATYAGPASHSALCLEG